MAIQKITTDQIREQIASASGCYGIDIQMVVKHYLEQIFGAFIEGDIRTDYWQSYAKRYLFGEAGSVSEHQIIFHKNFALRSTEFQRIAEDIHRNSTSPVLEIQPISELSPLLMEGR